MGRIEFRLLGPITAVAAGSGGDGSGAGSGDHDGGAPEAIALGGPKQRTVLAVLLLARGRVVSDEHLSAALWAGDAPASAAAQIHTYVSRLRRSLGPEVGLSRQHRGYALPLQDHALDVIAFERLCSAANEHLRARHFAEAARLLRAAMGLWRGPALLDATDQLRQAEVPRLDEARMVALEAWVDAELGAGADRARLGELIPEVSGLVARYPLRERLRAQLITLLRRADRRADALTVYLEGRRILDEELGVAPGPTLTAAARAALQPAAGP